MSGTLSCACAGEALVLDAERAAYWPARRTLLVTDVHFGKAHVLRRAGVALPRGSTTADLARLDRLIERHRPLRLVVLGDVVHGSAADTAEWLARVRGWSARHAAIERLVVRGNHDRHYDPTRLGFTVTGTLHEGPFAFAHHPAPLRDRYVLAGHLHPGIELVDHGGKMRLPVFWLGREVGVLPAFGRLTGLAVVAPEPDDRVVAIARDQLVPIDARALAGAGDARRRRLRI